MNSLTRWDPFAELANFQKQFFGDDFFTPIRSMNIPTTDVYTTDDKELTVEAHLPNFDEKDIDIHIENGALVIQAESHEKEEDKNKRYVVRESARSFYRSIRLPERAQADAIKARMDNGVLKVSIPLRELEAPKRIAIESKSKSK